MNDARKMGTSVESDPLVRSAYRSNAIEVVPAHLDQKVLNEAYRSISGGTFTPRFPGWISPAVFAATVVLSLTFYLEYDRMQSSTVADDAAHGLATAVKSTGRKLRALDSSTESLQSGNIPVPVGTSDAASIGSASAVPPAVERFCAGATTASEESWRLCIDGLQRSGRSEAARFELELLKAAYPQSDPALQ